MLWLTSESVLHMFSWKSLIVSSLTFRSLIHFELIFMYGIKEWSNVFFFLNMWLSSFPSTICWRDCLSSIVWSCVRCHRLLTVGAWAYFGFSICSIDRYFCCCATTVLFWWLELCSVVWSQGAWFLQLWLSFSKLFWLFRVYLAILCLHINFENFLF